MKEGAVEVVTINSIQHQLTQKHKIYYLLTTSVTGDPAIGSGIAKPTIRKLSNINITNFNKEDEVLDKKNVSMNNTVHFITTSRPNNGAIHNASVPLDNMETLLGNFRKDIQRNWEENMILIKVKHQHPSLVSSAAQPRRP